MARRGSGLEVFHKWAHGTDKRSGNVFSEGGTIYSYGHHFPMARRIVRPSGAVVFLFNPASYSPTTNGHQGATRRAAEGNGPCITVDPELWEDIIAGRGRVVADWYNAQIRAVLKSKGPKPTAPQCRVIEREMSALLAGWVSLHTAFGFRAAVGSVSASASADAIKEAAAAQAERDRTRDKAREAAAKAKATKRRTRAEKYLPLWRAGAEPDRANGLQGDFSISDLDYPALRIDPADATLVESSYGAAVPLASVRECWAQLVAVLGRGKAKGEERRVGVDLGGYGDPIVNGVGVRIGCHYIPWAELREFAAHAGLPALPAVE